MGPKAKKHASAKNAKKAAAGKKKKQSVKYAIECKNPVEDGIMEVNDFVSFHYSPL